jgi:ATP-dependent Clp protease ATP-binding subunit ClpC
MKAVLNELEKNRDIILFIDEIHTIVGAGNASGSLDASNMFKPALARGEIQCIGATTLDEYRQYIEKDGALERRFQKVLVDPTSPEETVEILNQIKEKYEDHHLVKYTPEAIEACVSLTNRYISDRYLPDKAIDALDEAGARVHISNMHVPVEILNIESQIEDARQKKMKAIKSQSLRKQPNSVIRSGVSRQNWKCRRNSGKMIQDKPRNSVVRECSRGGCHDDRGPGATHCSKRKRPPDEHGVGNSRFGDRAAGSDQKVVKAIRRNRAGLKDPNKPIGTFIFWDRPESGKPILQNSCRYLFDSEDALVRIDMSEYRKSSLFQDWSVRLRVM